MNLTPTSELHQPLLFAPSELLACGLRDAHSYPQVGIRTPDGDVRSWRMAASPETWNYQLVEWLRTGNSYAALGFDCDSRESVERAAASCMGAGDLPTPNVYSTRTASGHAQVFYLLDRPVYRGERARAKPLSYLGRVSEYYRASLGADPGYRGVLSSNPVHDDYQTSYPRTEPYTLDQLAGAIPKGWRVPHVPTTGEGKNCSLFAALCKLALGGSDEGLLTWARSLNREFDSPLPDAEVRGVWRSVCRYRARWRVQGHQQGWLWKQAARGKRGGSASHGGGRPRIYATAAERQRAYRGSVKNTHGGSRLGAGRPNSSVTKQANTGSTPRGALPLSRTTSYDKKREG